MTFEDNELQGDGVAAEAGNENAEVPEFLSEEEPGDLTGLALQLFKCWVRRKKSLDHDYAVAAWMLSVDPEVWNDCERRQCPEHKAILKRVVLRLHVAPCPNRDACLVRRGGRK